MLSYKVYLFYRFIVNIGYMGFWSLGRVIRNLKTRHKPVFTPIFAILARLDLQKDNTLRIPLKYRNLSEIAFNLNTLKLPYQKIYYDLY